MNNYENVTVDKLANIYFDGNVISRNITFQDGSKKILGLCFQVNMNSAPNQKN